MYRLVCLFLVSVATGEVVKNGICNYADIGGFVTDLNITQMFGTWNQVARYNNDQELGECSSLVIAGVYDANQTLIGVKGTHVEMYNKTKTTHSGTLEPVEADISGLYAINITGFYEGRFVVQATNYTDYAIFYSCETLTVANATAGVNDTKVVRAWQYHKKATLSTSEQTAVQEIVDVNPDLQNITWKHIDHSQTACGGGVALAIPHVLIILATLFISKEFV